MQYKCKTCYDTGSRDKLGTYLDCNACGTAATRRDLNSFVKALKGIGITHPEDVALAIHQRALAMAPKQEVAEIHCQEFHELAMDYRGASPLGAIAAYDALCKYVNQRIAAPAAANGALTDEAIYDISASCEIGIGHDDDDTKKRIDFARAILAAAGPDAALVKALESARLLLANTDGISKNNIDNLAGEEVIKIDAALSGAKGN